MKAMPHLGKNWRSLDGMTAMKCQQYWGIKPKVNYGQKNPTKYCPLECFLSRAVQNPVSTGKPSKVSLALTGHAKDAQFYSCSVIQATLQKVPLLTSYLGQILPSLLVSALATAGKLLCGVTGVVLDMRWGWTLTLIVWSLIIWHLSKSPSALFEVGRHLVIVDNWVKGEINLILKVMCALVPVPCAHWLYSFISHQL